MIIRFTITGDKTSLKGEVLFFSISAFVWRPTKSTATSLPCIKFNLQIGSVWLLNPLLNLLLLLSPRQPSVFSAVEPCGNAGNRSRGIVCESELRNNNQCDVLLLNILNTIEYWLLLLIYWMLLNTECYCWNN